MALIYLIDDDEDFGFFARRAVECSGHRGLVFSDSGAALNSFLTAIERPDMLLMDYTMPGLCAGDFIAQIRLSPTGGQIPVLVVSGIADLERIARDLGADGCLRKPFELDTMTSTLKRHLVIF